MQVIFYKDKSPEVFLAQKEIEDIAVWRTRTDDIIISKEYKLKIINLKENKK